MANEVTRLVAAGTAPANPINYTISATSDGSNVQKGSIMVFSGAYIIKVSSGLGQIFAGFANTEKDYTDGSTTLGVDTCGIYDCLVQSGGGCAIGDILITSGANILTPVKNVAGSGAYLATGAIVGRALEPIASNNDTIAVAVGIY